jgi:hypothetical protein
LSLFVSRRVPRPQGAAGAADVCYGVSWGVGGVPVAQATMRPVTEFPLAHPAATSSAAKTCMVGLGLGCMYKLNEVT